MTLQSYKYKSAFDIIGPIMVGPSSSHTAGAVRIGKLTHKLFKQQPQKISVTFYGSFAKTYKSHGTAMAIIAGVMGFDTDDSRIPDALELAEKEGILVEFLVSTKQTSHANTVNLVVSADTSQLDITAISIGGGSIQVTAVQQQSVLAVQKQDSGILFTVRQSKRVIPKIKACLAYSKLVEIQQLGPETLFLMEVTTEESLPTITKMKQIAGVTAVISTRDEE